MGTSQERKDYIDKLERLENGITKILELPSNRIVTSQIATKLAKLQTEANRMRRKLKSGEFEIAVVGLEKAGKSSFSNALSGLDILPTADARCTYTSTCIRAGQTNSATITFLTEDELNRDLREKLETLQIANASSWNLDNLTPEKYAQLYNDCPPDLQRQYEDTINADITEILNNKNSLRMYLNKPQATYTEEEITRPDFKGFITDPAKAMAVKEIVIYSTQLKEMPQAVLYDVPGFDSPTEMHMQQTLQKMDSADAIIAVANAKAPSLTKASLDVFKQPDSEGNALSDKLFVFANKADLVNDTKALDENRDTTRQEWIEKRKILAPHLGNRIVFGSAFAAEGDAGAQAKLAELGIEDGIGTIRAKLADYNGNERFEVLKRRIGKLLFDVKKLFEATMPRTTAGSDTSYLNNLNKIVLDLMDRLRPDLRNRLDVLKNDLNKTLEAEKPLSADIDNRIGNEITIEKYGLGDEETQQIHLKLQGINVKAERPPALDAYMRNDRFGRMYKDFSGGVLGSTVERHKDITESIRKLFMDALGLTPGQKGYDEMLLEVDKFCGSDAGNDNSYYDSLLERFGRDLFEALIMNSQGQERLNKFRAEMSNYFSMGVYYEKDDDDLNNINPVDSIFWRLLLYPELASAAAPDKLLEKIQNASGLPQIGKPIKNLVQKLYNQKGAGAEKELDNILKTLPRGVNEAVISAALKKSLEAATRDADEDINSLLDEGYLRDVQERRGNYTYKDVQKEFADDIAALRLALSRAFIPAVNMEKAFGARETLRIESLRDKLDTEEFRDFVASNAGLIEAAKLGELQMEESQRRADEAVMSEIGSILRNMEKNPGH